MVPGMLRGWINLSHVQSGQSYRLLLGGVDDLAPFCKLPIQAILSRITNKQLDPSLDQIKYSLSPILKRYYIDEGLELKINRRAKSPSSGGEVYFTGPVKRSLKPMQFVDPGLVI